MALIHKTEEINGLRVTTTQLPPRRAFKLAARLVKYLAPVFGSMSKDADLDTRAMSGALVQMMNDLDDKEIDKLLADVFASTQVVLNNAIHELNTPERIDIAFEGKLGTMLSSMKFVLMVNFGDFFDGSGLGAALAKSTTPAQ